MIWLCVAGCWLCHCDEFRHQPQAFMHFSNYPVMFTSWKKKIKFTEIFLLIQAAEIFLTFFLCLFSHVLYDSVHLSILILCSMSTQGVFKVGGGQVL